MQSNENSQAKMAKAGRKAESDPARKEESAPRRIVQVKTIPKPPPTPDFVPFYIPTERTSTASFRPPMSEEKKRKLAEVEVQPGTLTTAFSYFTSPVKYFTSMFVAAEPPKKPTKKVYKTSYKPPPRMTSVTMQEPALIKDELKPKLKHLVEPEAPSLKLDTSAIVKERPPLEPQLDYCTHDGVQQDSPPKTMFRKKSGMAWKIEKKERSSNPKPSRATKRNKQKNETEAHISEVTIANTANKYSYLVKSKDTEVKPQPPPPKKDPRKMYTKIVKKPPEPVEKTIDPCPDIYRRLPPSYIIRSYEQSKEPSRGPRNDFSGHPTPSNTTSKINATQYSSGPQYPREVSHDSQDNQPFKNIGNPMLQVHQETFPSVQKYRTASQLVQEAISSNGEYDQTVGNAGFPLFLTGAINYENMAYANEEDPFHQIQGPMTLLAHRHRSWSNDQPVKGADINENETVVQRMFPAQRPHPEATEILTRRSDIVVRKRTQSQSPASPQQRKPLSPTSKTQKIARKSLEPPESGSVFYEKKGSNVHKIASPTTKSRPANLSPKTETPQSKAKDTRAHQMSRTNSSPNFVPAGHSSPVKSPPARLEEKYSLPVTGTGSPKPPLPFQKVQVPSVPKPKIPVVQISLPGSSQFKRSDGHQANSPAVGKSPEEFTVKPPHFSNTTEQSNVHEATKNENNDPNKRKAKWVSIRNRESGKVIYLQKSKREYEKHKSPSIQNENNLFTKEKAEVLARSAATTIVGFVSRAANNIRELREEVKRQRMLDAAEEMEIASPPPPLPPPPPAAAAKPTAMPVSERKGDHYNRPGHSSKELERSKKYFFEADDKSVPGNLNQHRFRSTSRDNLEGKSKSQSASPKHSVRTEQIRRPYPFMSSATAGDAKEEPIKQTEVIETPVPTTKKKRVEDRYNCWTNYTSENPMLRAAASTMMGEMP